MLGKRLPRPSVGAGCAGQLGLYVFFLSFQLNTTAAYVGLLLMALVFAIQHAEWTPLLRREPVAYIFLALAIYIALYAGWAAHEFPETAQEQWTAWANWMHWLFFIPVAWSVFKDAKNINRLLLILAAGVMLRILAHTDWGDLRNLFTWKRTGFGYSEIVVALVFGVITLGLLLLAPRMTQAPTRPALRWALFGSWLFSLAVFLEAMVLSQTRSAWLAAVMVFPVALLARYRDWLRDYALKSLRGMAMLALAALVAGLFIVKNSGPILSRMHAEPEAVASLAKGEDKIPQTISIGVRFGLWRIGLRQWAERPFLGWGPGTTKFLLGQATTDPQLASHAHLHNLYLEILVRFGVLGGLLFASLILLLLHGVRQAYLNGLIPWDYACFLFAGWAFTAVFTVFDFQIFKYVWRNYCVIWAALSYAAQLETLRLSLRKTAGVGHP